MLRNIGVLLVALILGCSITPMIVRAETATVTTASANVRTEADTSSDVVVSVSSGDEVTIEDETEGTDGNAWYYVTTSNGSNGYIRSDLVSTEVVEQSSENALYVQAASANIRNESSTDGAIVANVSQNVELTVEGEETGSDGMTWYQISFTYSGETVEGYIRSDLVTTTEPAEEEAASTEITGTTSSEDDTEADTEVDTEEGEDTSANLEEETGEPTVEETATTTNSQSGYTIINAELEPNVPLGYSEVQVEWNGEDVRAWKNGDFFIFQAIDEEGNEGYVRYDSIYKVFQRYEESEAVAVGFFENMAATITMIVLVILLVVAIGIAILFYMKYSDSLIESELEHNEKYSESRKEKAKEAWKSLNFLLADEEEDDDEEEYEEDDDDEEEEDDYENYEDDDDDEDYEEDYIEEEPIIQQPVKKKPQPKQQVRRAVTPVKNPTRIASQGTRAQTEKQVQPVKQTQSTRQTQTTKQTQTSTKKEPVGMETKMLNEMEFIDIDSL